MRISICIPCYGMYGAGTEMIKRCLVSILTQTYKDFEVIVADNSDDNEIQKICDAYYYLKIKYYKNPKKGMAENTNFAISKATGDLIKILYQDDYLAHDNALQVIVDNFKETDNWLITACSNNAFPYYRPDANTLGSPSVLTIRNKDVLKFDENLKWVLDLDYYIRLYKKFGEPKIVTDVNVIIGLGDWQATNHLTIEDKLKEEKLYA